VTGTVAKTVLEMASIWAHNFVDFGALVKTVEIVGAAGELSVTPSIVPKSVAFSVRFLNQTVGTAIAKGDLGQYLRRMDLQPLGTDVIEVPSYRTDILTQTDIAGDLLVAVGIENLQAELPGSQFYMGQTDPLKDRVLRVSDLAQRMQLMEVRNFVLTDPALENLFASGGAELGDSSTGVFTGASAVYLETSNAKVRTCSVTRSSLQPGLLALLSRNIGVPKPLNIYETGEVIVPQWDAEGTLESWTESLYWGFASLDARASFAVAKRYMQTLLKAIGVAYVWEDCDLPRYIPGRAAIVRVNGDRAGHFGEIHPAILQNFSFPDPVCSGELDCRLLGSGKQAG
jgi:phenylalanyl-tRNA synthetase beta chain